MFSVNTRFCVKSWVDEIWGIITETLWWVVWKLGPTGEVKISLELTFIFRYLKISCWSIVFLLSINLSLSFFQRRQSMVELIKNGSCSSEKFFSHRNNFYTLWSVWNTRSLEIMWVQNKSCLITPFRASVIRILLPISQCYPVWELMINFRLLRADSFPIRVLSL